MVQIINSSKGEPNNVRTIKRFLKEEEGQDLVEYALLLAGDTSAIT